ncbi:hypothetical protein [Virgibacillus sp. YIM 98842]|nr:hypothetical protein [Virgibacillus sp. YIM 98842]
MNECREKRLVHCMIRPMSERPNRNPPRSLHNPTYESNERR